MVNVEVKTCIGCGKDFTVLELGVGQTSRFCTPECKEAQSILKPENK